MGEDRIEQENRRVQEKRIKEAVMPARARMMQLFIVCASRRR